MTKSTSPAANAGLPAIDRRSLVCGLGTAAVAGVPALAGAAPMSDDPVFQAMAALGQLKIHAEESIAAHSVAEGAWLDAGRKYGVTPDGKEMRTHEQIDAHFTPALRHFARTVYLTPNKPNVILRAKPLTTNWPE